MLFTEYLSPIVMEILNLLVDLYLKLTTDKQNRKSCISEGNNEFYFYGANNNNYYSDKKNYNHNHNDED